MKKIICFLLALMFTLTAFAGNTVTIYAPDGIPINVDEENVESYLSKGYGKSVKDVITTLYSYDGRSINVYNSEVPSYLNVGWHYYMDAITTLYTKDGRSLKIFKAEEDTYLGLGWLSYENATVTLFTPDGRSLKIFRSEEETYLALGWYKYEDVTHTLYTTDGRTLTIFKNEIDTYLGLGWLKYEDATTTLYASDQKTITVFKDEVPKYIELGWHEKRTIDPSKPVIAFTFDDGPHHTHTKSVINTLLAYDCTATFFMLGRLASSYPDIVKFAADNGMEIANHSYNHANLALLSAYGVSSDVSSASSSIYNAGGVYPKLLRPPYGSYNSTVKANAGLPLVLWSVDTLDWKSRNAYSVYNHILSNVKDGDIVLMHDIYSSTAEAVKMVVPELIKRGFQIVSVSELAEIKGYSLSSGNVYTHLK